MEVGAVSAIVRARGFGFIVVPNGPDVFFYRDALHADLLFDEQLIGRRVRCDWIDTKQGPRATDVRAAD